MQNISPLRARSSALLLSVTLLLLTGCPEPTSTPSDNTTSNKETPAPSLCQVVNGGLIDECPDGQFCRLRDDSDEYDCVAMCDEDDECSEGQECYDADNIGMPICAPARPVCSGDASQSDCDCGFHDGTDSKVFLVRGTGDDCEIVERDRTACYSQHSTCLNACVDQFFRYELGDGTALIIRGLQGGITQGWSGDGQGNAPSSCPILESEYSPTL